MRAYSSTAISLLALLGCGGARPSTSSASSKDSGAEVRTSLAAENYDRSCVSVADCVAVYVGAAYCCGVGCPNTAIRQTDLASYDEDLKASEKAACSGTSGNCHGGSGLGGISGCSGRIACQDALCVLEVIPAAPDAAMDE